MMNLLVKIFLKIFAYKYGSVEMMLGRGIIAYYKYFGTLVVCDENNTRTEYGEQDFNKAVTHFLSLREQG